MVMESINSSILPIVLEALSRKPHLCDTFENLCQDIREYVAAENGNAKPAIVAKALKRALSIGNNLGILTVANDMVRVPFKLRTEEKIINVMDESEDDYGEDEVDSGPTSRRKSVQPRNRKYLSEDELNTVRPASSLGKAPTDRSKGRRSRRGVGGSARGRGKGRRSQSRRRAIRRRR